MKQKHWLLTAAVFMLFLALTAFGASAADSGECGKDGDNVTWTLDNNGTLTIRGMGEMKAFATENGNGGAIINNPWFSSDVKIIVIEDGVTSIGDFAFYNCSSVTSVTIPDGVTSIGKGAFNGCSALTNISTPSSVTSIGDYAFYDCSSLTSVTIGDSVTSIGSGAFLNCSAITAFTVDAGNPNYASDENGCLYDREKTTLLQYPAGNGRTAFTVPDSVTGIGNVQPAFVGASSLVNITIPRSVTEIGPGSFTNCTALTAIAVDAENPNYVSDENGCLYDKNKTTLLQYPVGSSQTVFTIPDSVASIGYGAFLRCAALERINFPNSVTSIGWYAFDGCTALKEIKIPDSVTSIGAFAFSDCSTLEEINIPNGITVINAGTFFSCKSLTNIIIPNGVTSIGMSAFSGCESLESITIPNGVTSIGTNVFSGCTALASIAIPSSVTSIGLYAFSQCSALTDVYFEGTQSRWDQISIADFNEPLTSATFHWNTVIEAPTEAPAADTTASAGTDQKADNAQKTPLLIVIAVLAALVLALLIVLLLLLRKRNKRPTPPPTGEPPQMWR